MLESSEVVLDGFGLRTDATVIRHPDRYMDKRGADMWEKVTGILDRLGGRTTTRLWDTPTGHPCPVNYPSVGHPSSLMSYV